MKNNKKKSSKKKKNSGLKKLGRVIYNFFSAIYKIFDKLIVTPVTKLMLFVQKLFKTNNKPLDRLFNNKMFLVTLSLILAFGVFYFVDQTADIMLNSSADILTKQKVTALYNEEAYVIEGLPKTVDITLIGRQSDIYLAKQYPPKDVTVDLRGLKPGSHKVNLKYTGSVSSVQYKLDPTTATVVIYEKLSISKNISREILNQDKLNSKYTITNIKFDRDEVFVKGPQYKLDQVAIIKAMINIADIANPTVGSTTLKDINLIAYDVKGNKVDVEIVPGTISAVIEIASPSKEVPLKVIPEGTLVFGKAIDSITLSETKVTIYGPEEFLESVTYIPVKIDVSKLNSNQTFNINLSKPTGIKELSVPQVQVKVTVGDESEKTVTGINVSTINLGKGLTVRAATDADRTVDVIVKGTSKNLTGATSDNIQATVDLKDLGVGKHTIEVTATGNDAKLNYKPKTSTITIIIEKS